MYIEWGAERVQIISKVFILFAVFDFKPFREYKTEERQSFFQFSLQRISNVGESVSHKKKLTTSRVGWKVSLNFRHTHRFPWSDIRMKMVELSTPLDRRSCSQFLMSASATPTKFMESWDSSPWKLNTNRGLTVYDCMNWKGIDAIICKIKSSLCV